MIRTFAKTLTATYLSETGQAIRLQYPNAPYRLPHPCGGFLVLQRYGVPAGGYSKPIQKPVGLSPKTSCGTGCCGEHDHGHGHSHGSCNGAGGCGDGGGKPYNPFMAAGQSELVNVPQLLAVEIIQYSGFEDDGVTLRIVRRGCEGTIPQQWEAGTLAAQVLTGAELEDMLTAVSQMWDYMDSVRAQLDGLRHPKELTF